MRKINKKAQSEIISTVLLILIAITAIVVVTSFVIPFIKKQLSGTGCLDVSGKIEIKNNPKYTCWYTTANELRVQVHIGDTGNLTKGFQLSVEAGGSTKSFKITPDAELEGIRMYGAAAAPVENVVNGNTGCTPNCQGQTCGADDDGCGGICVEGSGCTPVATGGVILELPGSEEERTYIISGLADKPDSISVYPILEGGQVCGVSSTITTIPSCSA